MKKSFLVVGLGCFGYFVAKSLSQHTSSVIAVDKDISAVSRVSNLIEHCVVCDATKKSALDEINASHVDHAIVAIGNNMQATLLATINLKELGIKNITVRLDDEEYASVIKRLGATDVIIPEEASAEALANKIQRENIIDSYSINDEYEIIQLLIKEGFEPITIANLDSRNKYDINIVGIIREERFFIPKAQDSILPNDIVVAVGTMEKLSKFDKFLSK